MSAKSVKDKPSSAPVIRRHFTPRPSVERYYAKRPSWRSHGTGRAFIKMEMEDDGGLFIRAGEFPEELLGGKEVMVALSPEKVAELKKMLGNSATVDKRMRRPSAGPRKTRASRTR